MAEFSETLPGAARNALGVTTSSGSFDTALMGRSTYEIGVAAGVTNAYPHLRTLVFSRSVAGGTDPSVELVASDPVERVRALKNEPGAGLWLVGGGSLASSLYDEIDALVLKLAPITIGAGVPLFGDASTTFRLRNWQLQSSSTLSGGVSVLSFRRPA